MRDCWPSVPCVDECGLPSCRELKQLVGLKSSPAGAKWTGEGNHIAIIISPSSKQLNNVFMRKETEEFSEGTIFFLPFRRLLINESREAVDAHKSCRNDEALCCDIMGTIFAVAVSSPCFIHVSRWMWGWCIAIILGSPRVRTFRQTCASSGELYMIK